jgi:hypothetical protein
MESVFTVNDSLKGEQPCSTTKSSKTEPDDAAESGPGSCQAIFAKLPGSREGVAVHTPSDSGPEPGPASRAQSGVIGQASADPAWGRRVLLSVWRNDYSAIGDALTRVDESVARALSGIVMQDASRRDRSNAKCYQRSRMDPERTPGWTHPCSAAGIIDAGPQPGEDRSTPAPDGCRSPIPGWESPWGQ